MTGRQTHRRTERRADLLQRSILIVILRIRFLPAYDATFCLLCIADCGNCNMRTVQIAIVHLKLALN